MHLYQTTGILHVHHDPGCVKGGRRARCPSGADETFDTAMVNPFITYSDSRPRTGFWPGDMVVVMHYSH